MMSKIRPKRDRLKENRAAAARSRVTETNDKKKFTIPKRIVSKDLLQECPLEDRACQDLIKGIHNSFWNPKSSMKILKVEFVNNESLSEEFSRKRRLMKHDGRTALELADRFCFKFCSSHERGRDLCKNGLSTTDQNKSLVNCLGDPTFGVYLSRCADIVSRYSFLPGFDGHFVVFKVIRGRMKAIQEQHGDLETLLEPSPDFDGHMSKSFQRGSKISISQSKVFDSAQLYLYEIDIENFSAEDDSLYSRKPRHCFPYALVHFRYGSPGTALSSAPVAEIKTTIDKTPKTPAKSAESIQRVQKSSTVPSPSFPRAFPIKESGQILWKGRVFNKSKYLGESQISCYSRTQYTLPLASNSICFRLKVKMEQIRDVFPQRLYSCPPAVSRNPKAFVDGKNFLHCELHPSSNRTRLPKLCSFLKEHDQVLRMDFSHGNKMFVIPTSKLTDQLGITDKNYLDVLHVIFTNRRCEQNPMIGEANESFLRSARCILDKKFLEIEELKLFTAGAIPRHRQYHMNNTSWFTAEEKDQICSSINQIRKALSSRQLLMQKQITRQTSIGDDPGSVPPSIQIPSSLPPGMPRMLDSQTMRLPLTQFSMGQHIQQLPYGIAVPPRMPQGQPPFSYGQFASQTIEDVGPVDPRLLKFSKERSEGAPNAGSGNTTVLDPRLRRAKATDGEIKAHMTSQTLTTANSSVPLLASTHEMLLSGIASTQERSLPMQTDRGIAFSYDRHPSLQAGGATLSQPTSLLVNTGTNTSVSRISQIINEPNERSSPVQLDIGNAFPYDRYSSLQVGGGTLSQSSSLPVNTGINQNPSRISQVINEPNKIDKSNSVVTSLKISHKKKRPSTDVITSASDLVKPEKVRKPDVSVPRMQHQGVGHVQTFKSTEQDMLLSVLNTELDTSDVVENIGLEIEKSNNSETEDYQLNRSTSCSPFSDLSEEFQEWTDQVRDIVLKPKRQISTVLDDEIKEQQPKKKEKSKNLASDSDIPKKPAKSKKLASKNNMSKKQEKSKKLASENDIVDMIRNYKKPTETPSQVKKIGKGHAETSSQMKAFLDLEVKGKKANVGTNKDEKQSLKLQAAHSNSSPAKSAIKGVPVLMETDTKSPKPKQTKVDYENVLEQFLLSVESTKESGKTQTDVTIVGDNGAVTESDVEITSESEKNSNERPETSSLKERVNQILVKKRSLYQENVRVRKINVAQKPIEYYKRPEINIFIKEVWTIISKYCNMKRTGESLLHKLMMEQANDTGDIIKSVNVNEKDGCRVPHDKLSETSIRQKPENGIDMQCDTQELTEITLHTADSKNKLGMKGFNGASAKEKKTLDDLPMQQNVIGKSTDNTLDMEINELKREHPSLPKNVKTTEESMPRKRVKFDDQPSCDVKKVPTDKINDGIVENTTVTSAETLSHRKSAHKVEKANLPKLNKNQSPIAPPALPPLPTQALPPLPTQALLPLPTQALLPLPTPPLPPLITEAFPLSLPTTSLACQTAALACQTVLLPIPVFACPIPALARATAALPLQTQVLSLRNPALPLAEPSTTTLNSDIHKQVQPPEVCNVWTQSDVSNTKSCVVAKLSHESAASKPGAAQDISNITINNNLDKTSTLPELLSTSKSLNMSTNISVSKSKVDQKRQIKVIPKAAPEQKHTVSNHSSLSKTVPEHEHILSKHASVSITASGQEHAASRLSSISASASGHEFTVSKNASISKSEQNLAVLKPSSISESVSDQELATSKHSSISKTTSEQKHTVSKLSTLSKTVSQLEELVSLKNSKSNISKTALSILSMIDKAVHEKPGPAHASIPLTEKTTFEEGQRASNHSTDDKETQQQLYDRENSQPSVTSIYTKNMATPSKIHQISQLIVSNTTDLTSLSGPIKRDNHGQPIAQGKCAISIGEPETSLPDIGVSEPSSKLMPGINSTIAISSRTTLSQASNVNDSLSCELKNSSANVLSGALNATKSQLSAQIPDEVSQMSSEPSLSIANHSCQTHSTNSQNSGTQSSLIRDSFCSSLPSDKWGISVPTAIGDHKSQQLHQSENTATVLSTLKPDYWGIASPEMRTTSNSLVQSSQVPKHHKKSQLIVSNTTHLTSMSRSVMFVNSDTEPETFPAHNGFPESFSKSISVMSTINSPAIISPRSTSFQPNKANHSLSGNKKSRSEILLDILNSTESQMSVQGPSAVSHIYSPQLSLMDIPLPSSSLSVASQSKQSPSINNQSNGIQISSTLTSSSSSLPSDKWGISVPTSAEHHKSLQLHHYENTAAVPSTLKLDHWGIARPEMCATSKSPVQSSQIPKHHKKSQLIVSNTTHLTSLSGPVKRDSCYGNPLGQDICVSSETESEDFHPQNDLPESSSMTEPIMSTINYPTTVLSRYTSVQPNKVNDKLSSENKKSEILLDVLKATESQLSVQVPCTISQMSLEPSTSVDVPSSEPSSITNQSNRQTPSSNSPNPNSLIHGSSSSSSGLWIQASPGNIIVMEGSTFVPISPAEDPESKAALQELNVMPTASSGLKSILKNPTVRGIKFGPQDILSGNESSKLTPLMIDVNHERNTSKKEEKQREDDGKFGLPIHPAINKLKTDKCSPLSPEGFTDDQTHKTMEVLMLESQQRAKLLSERLMSPKDDACSSENRPVTNDIGSHDSPILMADVADFGSAVEKEDRALHVTSNMSDSIVTPRDDDHSHDTIKNKGDPESSPSLYDSGLKSNSEKQEQPVHLTTQEYSNLTLMSRSPTRNGRTRRRSDSEDRDVKPPASWINKNKLTSEPKSLSTTRSRSSGRSRSASRSTSRSTSRSPARQKPSPLDIKKKKQEGSELWCTNKTRLSRSPYESTDTLENHSVSRGRPRITSRSCSRSPLRQIRQHQTRSRSGSPDRARVTDISRQIRSPYESTDTLENHSVSRGRPRITSRSWSRSPLRETRQHQTLSGSGSPERARVTDISERLNLKKGLYNPSGFKDSASPSEKRCRTESNPGNFPKLFPRFPSPRMDEYNDNNRLEHATTHSECSSSTMSDARYDMDMYDGYQRLRGSLGGATTRMEELYLPAGGKHAEEIPAQFSPCIGVDYQHGRNEEYDMFPVPLSPNRGDETRNDNYKCWDDYENEYHYLDDNHYCNQNEDCSPPHVQQWRYENYGNQPSSRGSRKLPSLPVENALSPDRRPFFGGLLENASQIEGYMEGPENTRHNVQEDGGWIQKYWL